MILFISYIKLVIWIWRVYFKYNPDGVAFYARTSDGKFVVHLSCLQIDVTMSGREFFERLMQELSRMLEIVSVKAITSDITSKTIEIIWLSLQVESQFEYVWLGIVLMILVTTFIVMIYQWYTRPIAPPRRFPPNYSFEVDGVMIYYYNPDDDSDPNTEAHED